MNVRSRETLPVAVALLLMILTASGNAALLGLVSAIALIGLLGWRLFFRSVDTHPGWIIAATVVGISLAIAIVRLLLGAGI